MLEAQAFREIIVTVHGLKESDGTTTRVHGRLFTDKMNKLISALQEADRAVNSTKRLEYYVSHLKIGSAEFGLIEQPKKHVEPVGITSSVNALMECSEAIYRSNFGAANKYNGLVKKIADFANGAGEWFSHIEFGEAGQSTLQADKFFADQAKRLLAERDEPQAQPTNFRGQCVDAIDGTILEVDFRGRIWRGILVPTGARKEIQCVFPQMRDEKEVLDNTKRRVLVTGNAIYDGYNLLPAKFEVLSFRPISTDADPRRWHEALRPFELTDWDESERDDLH